MKYFLLTLPIFLMSCAMPRLGLNTIKYDDVYRSPLPESQIVRIFSSREDIPYKFEVIGRVEASPPRAERDFGHDPIFYLKKQAREVGGIGLINLKNKDENHHMWSAEVIVKK
jgi:inosine/xanthosine triphosphate pyrophosphatase family protein